MGGHYGLFAVMTRTRDEVFIEFSDDYGRWARHAETNVDPVFSAKNAGSSGGNNARTTVFSAAEKAQWKPVEFAFKPGSTRAETGFAYKPMWLPGHMPRLDWMLWFLALKPDTQMLKRLYSRSRQLYDQEDGSCAADHSAQKALLAQLRLHGVRLLPPYFLRLLIGLLTGDAAVLSLLHSTRNTELWDQNWEIDANDASANGLHDTGSRYIRVRLIPFIFNEAWSWRDACTFWKTPTTPMWRAADAGWELLPPVNITMLRGILRLLQEDDGEVVEDTLTGVGAGEISIHAKSPRNEGAGTGRAAAATRARLPAHLQPETAAQMIQRTLFRGSARSAGSASNTNVTQSVPKKGT